ncbi:MAG: flavin reductase family protein [Ruminococcaceae bacterium]|nr:flavin reductase family protein [Oscillospiraceae bacterium]
MSKIKLNGGALLAPLPPVMVSCGSGEAANILTIAWTGILNTVPPKTYIAVRPRRHSHALIKESGEFVLNLTPASLARAADYCGMYTGAKVNKWEKCHLTPVAVEEVSVPLIAECPLSLCCKVTEIRSEGTHDIFFADIVGVYAEEGLMDERGKLHLERADLCAYAHGEYFALGKRLGAFGFSAAKKKKSSSVNQKKRR